MNLTKCLFCLFLKTFKQSIVNGKPLNSGGAGRVKAFKARTANSPGVLNKNSQARGFSFSLPLIYNVIFSITNFPIILLFLV